MKKVLIIAHLFHASPRIPGLAKYLPEFGWQPVILTTAIGEKPDSRFGPPNDIKSNTRVVETSYYDVIGSWKKRFGLIPEEGVKKQFRVTTHKNKKSLIDHILIFGGEFIAYPDAQKGWYNYAVKAGSEVLKNEDIDAMISSSSPVTSHIIAKELKIKHKIPWVADFRDLWSQNHYYVYGPLRKLVDKRLELKTLLPADALVTVTPLWAEEMRALHKGKTVYTITNGFDPDKMSKGQIDLMSKFTITYTGLVLYTGKQDPSKLFAALHDLISDGTMDPNEVEVRFYGPEEEWLEREIEKYRLLAIAKQYGVVPRQTSIEKQRESQLLLLLNWEGQEGRGWHSLKIFEYMASQRPILATGGLGNDAIKELLEETKAGMYCKTVEDIKIVLSKLYSEYKRKGKISYKGDIEKIDKYSHREMARKFAEVLDQVTSK